MLVLRPPPFIKLVKSDLLHPPPLAATPISGPMCAAEQRRELPQQAGAANLGGLLFSYFIYTAAQENGVKRSFGEG